MSTYMDHVFRTRHFYQNGNSLTPGCVLLLIIIMLFYVINQQKGGGLLKKMENRIYILFKLNWSLQMVDEANSNSLIFEGEMAISVMRYAGQYEFEHHYCFLTVEHIKIIF